MSTSVDHLSLVRLATGPALDVAGGYDPQTGLPDEARLIAAIDARPGVPLRLDVIAVGGDDVLGGLGEPDLAPAIARGIASVLRAAADPADAVPFRVAPLAFALLGPAESTAMAVTAAQTSLDERSRIRARGEALLPADGPTGAMALRTAVQRLRARSRWQGESAERQVRDVLLQLLAERAAAGPAGLTPTSADAVAVGRELGLGLSELDELVRAAELQDVGRIAIPEAILTKQSKLDTAEWQVVRTHPVVGERILAAAPALAPVARLVRSCYERFDGTGYPDGLRGEEIPLGARIIAVCVAFEAMTSPRPYRPALPHAAAFEELCRCAGRQFDPHVVAAFCSVMRDPRASTGRAAVGAA